MRPQKPNPHDQIKKKAPQKGEDACRHNQKTYMVVKKVKNKGKPQSNPKERIKKRSQERITPRCATLKRNLE